MRVFEGFLLAWSSLVIHVFASPQLQVENRPLLHRDRDANSSTLLPPPSADPWFQPPADWQLKTPGSVLKVRKSPYSNITIANCIDTFQVQYRTTDTHNNASWAVSTQFIPASHAKCNATHPELCAHGIVSYEIPYDSADPDATPGYLLQWGEPYGEMSDLLARGWFVSVPDYEGPLSSYCAGVQAGHATLDSVRAVLQVAGDFGLRTADARAALWGYSGGAMATEFAAELAGSYTPDLKLAGVVEGGTAPNITTVGKLMNGKDTAGLLVAGLVGITSQHTEARQYILSRLKNSGPYNITGFLNATNMSGVQALVNYMYQDVYKYFLGGESDLDSKILTDMYNQDAVMGYHGTPNMPMFIYKAISDEMSAVNETDALVDSFCKQGANILYHRNSIGGHNQELWQGRHRALDFLAEVLDGTNGTNVTSGIEIPQKGCLVKNVTVAVTVKVVNGSIVVNPVNVTVLSNGTVTLTPARRYVEGARLRNMLDVLGFARGLF
ncbi:related to lipase 1 [Phialocephala subalpina]|uniref:Related to lipase 1 n=1 Tax=Phialocephala subalpina TaxID=576137 RepID=A0A1L7WFQ5_9HELO|nr:related to lipase 1 [Phialocephala subalpina]